MTKPLTYEQIWGEPEMDLGTEWCRQPADFCPYKDVQCPYWDGGCQPELCVYEIDGGETG
ncbi:MAG TPA: hypothetical protein HPP87_04615 [Planctomycetes bacterium]|nr:hypothetical protein [Planctomycetota bacterium]HIJ70630.1 hypothetical protein [Planctomycetota bacterium]